MKITVIGAGAMGSLFGGLLAEAGQDVSLLHRDPQLVSTLNEQGVRIERNNRVRQIRVHAVTRPEEIIATDLTLLCIKHGQTAAATESAIRLCGGPGVLMSLQNGMGNGEIIAATVAAIRAEIPIICGSTAQGAMLLHSGRVQHSGVGKTIIGIWQGEIQSVVDEITDIFTQAGIPTEQVHDIRPVLWSKLFANVAINGISALTNTCNGQLLELRETRELMEAAVQEAIVVAEALGVAIAKDTLENVFAIARATASNRSSMGQDVDAKRGTEIEAINGYIVRQAAALGIATPVNQTILSLVTTLEAHY